MSLQANPWRILPRKFISGENPYYLTTRFEQIGYKGESYKVPLLSYESPGRRLKYTTSQIDDFNVATIKYFYDLIFTDQPPDIQSLEQLTEKYL